MNYNALACKRWLPSLLEMIHEARFHDHQREMQVITEVSHFSVHSSQGQLERACRGLSADECEAAGLEF